MVRFAWGLAALCVLAGCQSLEGLSGLQSREQPAENYASTHSQPQPEVGSTWRNPASQEESPEEILQYATEQDNAHRRNPADVESLRNARLAYERILQTNPQHGYVLHRLGTVADREGRFLEAEQYYRAALRLNPNSVDLMSDLGYSYLLQGRLAESEQLLQQVLHLNPQQPKARVNLGIVYAKMGRPDDAYALIRTERTEAESRDLVARAGQFSPPPATPNGAPPSPNGPLPSPATLAGRAQSAETNKATQQLRAAIEKARAERQQQQAGRAAQQAALAAQAAWDNPAQAPAPLPVIQPAAGVDPRWSSRELPPEEWNTAFRQIDQAAEARRYAAQPITASPVQTASAQHIQEPAPAPSGVYPLTPPRIPADVRTQAAQLGLQAGGGTLFAPPPGQVAAPAPRTLGTAMIPPPADPRQPFAPAAAPPSAANELSGEQSAELQLLNEQVRQLQEQIAQKRAELDRSRQASPW